MNIQSNAATTCRLYIKCSLRFSACSRTISVDWWSHADNFNCVLYLQERRILEFSDYPCALHKHDIPIHIIYSVFVNGRYLASHCCYSFAIPVNCILCNLIQLINRKSMSFWSIVRVYAVQWHTTYKLARNFCGRTGGELLSRAIYRYYK